MDPVDREGVTSFLCRANLVLRVVALCGAVAATVWQGRIPVVVLWISLGGYAVAFVSSFVRGCCLRCPQRGVAPAADFIFAVVLATSSGGLDSPFVLTSVLVIGLNGLRMGAARAAIYGAAAGALVGLSTSAPAMEWPRALGTAACFPTLATLVSYLRWCGNRDNDNRVELEEELRREAQEIESQKGKIDELHKRLEGVAGLASVGRASAEIIHQIRDPLSAISLNLEMLEEDLEDEGKKSEEVREILLQMEREVTTLGDLAENYLQYARLAAPKCQPESLEEIVREVLLQEVPHFEYTGVTVYDEVGSGLPRVNVDRRQVKFALHNVLENAREATQEGGRVRISAVMKNGRAGVKISDTGCGIPRANVPDIFDAFFTTKRGGTGLGLSLARKIVEQHGGRIECESLAEVGTTFEILFPTVEEEEGT